MKHSVVELNYNQAASDIASVSVVKVIAGW